VLSVFMGFSDSASHDTASVQHDPPLQTAGELMDGLGVQDMALERPARAAELLRHVGLLGQVLTRKSGDLLLELGQLAGRVRVAEDVHGVKPIDPVSDGSERLAVDLAFLVDHLVAELGHILAEPQHVLFDELLAFALKVLFHEGYLLIPGAALFELHLDVLDGRKLRRAGHLEGVPRQAKPTRQRYRGRVTGVWDLLMLGLPLAAQRRPIREALPRDPTPPRLPQDGFADSGPIRRVC